MKTRARLVAALVMAGGLSVMLVGTARADDALTTTGATSSQDAEGPAAEPAGEYPGPCPPGTTALNSGDGAVVHTTDDGPNSYCVNYRAGENVPGPCPGTDPGVDNGGHRYTQDGACHNVSPLRVGPCDAATSPSEANAHIDEEGVGCTDYVIGSGPCPADPAGGGEFHAINLIDGSCAEVAGVIAQSIIQPATPTSKVEAPQLPRTGISRAHLLQSVQLATTLLTLGLIALGSSHRARRIR